MAKESKIAPVGAVYKAHAILDMLSEGAFPLKEIALRVGMPKSSALRFLDSLIDLGTVKKNEDRLFSLTPQLFSMGAKSLGALDVVSAALPAMRALSTQTAETVHLAVRSGQSVVYLHKVDTPHALRMRSRTGYQAPLYCTALGKCLLAWLDEERAETLIREISFSKVMPNTIADADALRAHLAMVREQGFACDNEENEENVICFGAPVFNWASQVMAAISVSIPMFRFTEYDKQDIIGNLRQAALRISITHGYQAGEQASEYFPCANPFAGRQ